MCCQQGWVPTFTSAKFQYPGINPLQKVSIFWPDNSTNLVSADKELRAALHKRESSGFSVHLLKLILEEYGRAQ